MENTGRFPDVCTISKDKARLHADKVYAMLSKAYWAKNRARDAVLKSIENAECYGAYYNKEQIGFARVITDCATLYYLSDVVIDERYRGRGIGKRLVETVLQDDELKGLIGILGTVDAHGLYERYGFVRVPDRFMRRMPVKP